MRFPSETPPDFPKPTVSPSDSPMARTSSARARTAAVSGFAGRFGSYSTRVRGSGASAAVESATSPRFTDSSRAASRKRALPQARARSATMLVAFAPSSGPMFTTVPASRSTSFAASRILPASALTADTPCAKSRPACAARPSHSMRKVALPRRSRTSEPSGSDGSIARPSPPSAAQARASARITRWLCRLPVSSSELRSTVHAGATPASESTSSAWIMITSPPFMSIAPGPTARPFASRASVWNEPNGSCTVSR